MNNDAPIFVRRGPHSDRVERAERLEVGGMLWVEAVEEVRRAAVRNTIRRMNARAPGRRLEVRTDTRGRLWVVRVK